MKVAGYFHFLSVLMLNNNTNMKNLFKFTLVAAVVVAMTTACGNKEEKTEATADTTSMAAPAVDTAAAAPVATDSVSAAAEAAAPAEGQHEGEHH